MLCCIISETVCTASNAIIKILYKVILKILVFSIYIRKSTHLTCCTLKAVAPLCNFLKAICVIKIFLATNSIYLEIMPSGVSKASGLHDLCALMSKSMKNTVFIGDYYNDLELMREAGYAVAVANAPAEVKAAADHVTTCTCAEGAVGEYLYSLIGKTEG